MSKPIRHIMLDRDGTISIERTDYVKTIQEFNFIEGSLEALKIFTDSNLDVIIITNQSAVGRRKMTEEELQKIHAHMLKRIKRAGGKVSGIYYCPHRPEDRCGCRKPGIGLFLQAKAEHGFEFEDCLFIGDKEVDIVAGRNAGIRTIKVRTNEPNSLLRVAEEVTGQALPK